MKNRIIIAITAVLLLFAFNSNAQKESHEERMEKFKAEKIAFITSKLNLTPAEAQKFWPVYNEMEKERWESQKTRRELETRVSEAEESLSEKEIIKLTKDFTGSMQKEADLLKTYNEKFLTILPPKKVLKLYQSENEFRVMMIKTYRDRNRNEKEKHP